MRKGHAPRSSRKIFMPRTNNQGAATSDTPLPKEVAGKAAQVWLADDKLSMRAL